MLAQYSCQQLYTAGVREFGDFEPHRQLVSVGYDTVKDAKCRF